METPDINKSNEDKLVEQKNFVQKAASFATSMASKGIDHKRSTLEVKNLRKLSCHGDDTLAPCSQRKPSQNFENSFFCGACGCGDKQGTQLVDLTIQGKENYGKLDYPKVWCPLNMPGFQPYKTTSEEPPEMVNMRKKELENRFGIEYITEMSKGEPQ